MTCLCCNNIYKIGCYDHCGANLVFPMTALQTGTYLLEYEYLGKTYTIESDFTEGQEITFIVDELAAATYVSKLTAPDGTEVTYEENNVVYDCFSWQTKYSTNPQSVEPLVTCANNILYVDGKCGNDASAIIGDIHRPWKTIKAAVKDSTSNVQQILYILPATYNESELNKGSDGVEKRGLVYYFLPNAIVNGGGSRIFNCATINTDGKITIRGSGTFISTSAFIFSESNVTIDWDIECLEVINNGTTTSHNAITHKKGKFSLVCKRITNTGGFCLNVRTGPTEGYVDVDVIDNSGSLTAVSAIIFKDNTAAGTKWNLNVREVRSNGTGFGGGVTMDTGNSGAPIVYFNGNIKQTPAAPVTYSHGIACNTGTLIFSGNIDCTGGHGVVSVGGLIVVKDSRVKTTGAEWAAISMMHPPGTGTVVAQNSTFINDSALVGAVQYQSSTTATLLQCESCIIKNVNPTAGARSIQMNNAANQLSLFHSVVWCADGFSIEATAPVTVKIWSTPSNMPKTGAITTPIEDIIVEPALTVVTW